MSLEVNGNYTRLVLDLDTVHTPASNLPPPPSNSPSDSNSIQKPNRVTEGVDPDLCVCKERPSHLYSAQDSLSEVQSLTPFKGKCVMTMSIAGIYQIQCQVYLWHPQLYTRIPQL